MVSYSYLVASKAISAERPKVRKEYSGDLMYSGDLNSELLILYFTTSIEWHKRYNSNSFAPFLWRLGKVLVQKDTSPDTGNLWETRVSMYLKFEILKFVLMSVTVRNRNRN